MPEPEAEGTPSPETVRAEQAVDTAGRMIGDFAARVGYGVARVVAQAREGAEDIVAEARSMSQSQNP